MFRKSTLLLTLLLVVVVSVSLQAEQLYQQTTPIANAESIIKPSYRAACAMQKTNLTAASYYSGYTAGMGTVMFYDPVVECAGAFPYAISDFAFTLYDDGAGNNWPQTVDIVVYAMADAADSCQGPGAELCRYTMSPDQPSYLFPNMGTYILPTPCCIDAPVFIGVEYTAGTLTPVHSLLFDDQVAGVCEPWNRLADGTWLDWSTFWTPPPPGNPIFAVGGEIDATVCLPTTDCPVWADGDLYKSENPPQLPDESGWDVNATFPKVLADDFMCGETGYIKDVHFWGSWLDGNPGTVTSFVLSFHTDIPANQSPTGHSMPGELLWEQVITVFTETPIIGNDLEGWYDPYTGDILADNHQEYMQYDVCLDPSIWFPQEEGIIYWLNVSANVEPATDGIDRLWGWKSTQDHWNDDAVWLGPTIAGDCVVPDDGTGTVVIPTDLCEYNNDVEVMKIVDNDLPAGTTIEWPPRLHSFNQVSESPGGFLGGTSVSFNATLTMQMTGTGALAGYSRTISMPVNGRIETVPRTPGDPVQDFDTEMVSLSGTIIGDPDFIQLSVTAGAASGLPSPGHTTLTELPGGDFNVDSYFDIPYKITFIGAPGSMLTDVAGTSSSTVRIETGGPASGGWTEMYEPLQPTVSMDLSFVITGDPNEISGACCLPDGTCIDTDAVDCAAQGGDYNGDGTDCASVDCNDAPVAKCQDIVLSADANCEGCGSIDAGSYDPNGDPIILTQTPPCPYPLGTTSVLLTVTDPAGATDSCRASVIVVDNTPPVPICPADMTVTVPAGSGGTNVTFAISATDNCPGVVVTATPPSGSFFPVGVTTVTVVAVDAAGLSEICTFKVTVREDPPVGCPPWAVGDPFKTENPPQLPDEAGWNVNATAPKTLADDFMCGETGYIKDIHFWGSWLDGVAGNIDGFIISFHEDIPANQSPTGHSMPGKLLYERKIDNFSQNAILGAYMEGWYDPWAGSALPNNHQEYWQYDICLDPDDWFRQEQGTIYWLNISAIVELGPNEIDHIWGWKSSMMHWNDDAVHMQSPDLTCSVASSSGTAHMPPDCPLVPQDGGNMVITDGLPPGTTIEIELVAMNLSGQSETPNTDGRGGTIGTWQTEMISMQLTGTGALSGFSRTMAIQGPTSALFGDRHPPDPVQPFDTEILSMDLSLFGDPDFDLLRIVAGSDEGLPSPGHTTLTRISGGNWSVDSFFDITYEIEFQGAPGSALEGMGGTTTGSIRMGTDNDSDENADWREMYEPLHILGPIVNNFQVEVDPSGNVVNGSGENAFGEGWYQYPTNNWWNVWFYDHKFDANRFKQMHVEFDVIIPDPSGDSRLEFALNWSTDAWSIDQPATDSAPPLPGTDEDLYIQRAILMDASNPDGHYSFDYTIDTYNPEWVSIDVRGFNFLIDGLLIHECIGEGVGQSLDLAFVITGDTVSAPTGACCQPDGTCSDTDAASCAANSGIYKGDGTTCATANICGCCGTYTNGFTGNTTCDVNGKRNLASITRLIDHVYITKDPLCCAEEGNVDGDAGGKKNLADITALIDHVYISKDPTAPCL